jgi:hypothetical protein
VNPFTIDHPLTAKSWDFNFRKHPLLSHVVAGFALALILTPFVLVRLYYWFISDIGCEPDPFPEPWRALFLGGAIAFVFSCLIAFPAVILVQWLVRKWRS